METKAKILSIGQFAVLITAIICLIFNLEIIYIMHSSLGELPIVIYVIYYARDLILFYVIILLSALTLFFVFIQKASKLLRILVLGTPIIMAFLLLLVFQAPQSIILFPKGSGTTELEALYGGGWISITLAIASIIISSIFLISKKSFSKPNMKKLLIFLGFLLIGGLVAEFFHESGHALFVLISGGTVTQFIPIPWFIGGEWVAGFVSYTGVPINLEPLVLLGSEIVQWSSIIFLALILHFRPTIKGNRFIWGWFIFAWLDFPLYAINNSMGISHWFLFGGSRGDIISFCYITGFPLWIMIMLACVQLFFGTLVIYKNMKKPKLN